MNEENVLDIEETLPADPDVPESDQTDISTDQEVEEQLPEDEAAAAPEDDEAHQEASEVEVIEYTPDNPMPVTIVEPVAEETELEVFSLSGSYHGTISSQYLDYFAGIVQKLHYDQHYVVYRSGQYSYTMVYGEEVALEGSRFVGSGNVVNLYRASSSSNNDWYVDYSTDTLALSADDLFVYSDLGMYPTLKRGGSSLEAAALLFAVGFAVVYVVCHDIFDYIMQHIYR